MSITIEETFKILDNGTNSRGLNEIQPNTIVKKNSEICSGPTELAAQAQQYEQSEKHRDKIKPSIQNSCITFKIEYQFIQDGKQTQSPIDLDDFLYQPHDSNKYFLGLLYQLCYDLEASVKSYMVQDVTFNKITIPLAISEQKYIGDQLDICSKQFQLKLKEKQLSQLKFDQLLELIDADDYQNLNEIVMVFNIEYKKY